jgi:hypothetical protein
MIILYPIDRSIGHLFIGLLAVYFALALPGMIAGLLWVIGIFSIYWGMQGIALRKKRPLELNDDTLAFYKGRNKIVINRSDIENIWLNTSGIDKRVSIITSQQEMYDIPVPYGLSSLAKRLNDELLK